MIHPRCPTCGCHLRAVVGQEKKEIILKYPKWDDEEVWHCLRCKEYIFEEDFLFITE
jgi:uncharacterized protein with PIN domain